MKFNVLTCDKQTFSDGKLMYKIIGTLDGDEVENGSQVITFYSSTSAVPKSDYEVELLGTKDMKSLKVRLKNQIFKK